MDQPLTPSQQYTLSSTLHPLSPSAPWPFPVPVRSSAQVMISDEGKEIVDTDFRFRSDLPIQAHNLDPYFWLGFTPQEKLMRRVETVPSPGDQPAGPEHELQKVPGQVETVFNQSSLDCLDLTTNQLSDSTLMNGTAGDQQNQELESILAGQIYYHYYSDQTAPSIESSLPSAHIFPSSPKSLALPSSKFQSLQPEQDKGLGIGIDDDSALESDLKGSKKLRMTPEEEGIKLRVKKGKNFKTSVLLSEAKENGAKANQACDECGKRFRLISAFKKHKLSHKGKQTDRQFICTVEGCSKRFTTSSNAKRHNKTHLKNGTHLGCTHPSEGHIASFSTLD